MIDNKACLASHVLHGKVCSTIAAHASGSKGPLRATSKAFYNALPPPARLRASGPSDITAMSADIVCTYLGAPETRLRLASAERIYITDADTEDCVYTFSQVLQHAASEGLLHPELRVDMASKVLDLGDPQMFGEALANVATVAKGGMALDLKVRWGSRWEPDPMPVILSCLSGVLEECGVYKVRADYREQYNYISTGWRTEGIDDRMEYQRWQLHTSAAAVEQATTPQMLERIQGGELVAKRWSFVDAAITALPGLQSIVVDGPFGVAFYQDEEIWSLPLLENLKVLCLSTSYVDILMEMAGSLASLDHVSTLTIYHPYNVDWEDMLDEDRLEEMNDEESWGWRQVLPSLKKVVWHSNMPPPGPGVFPDDWEVQVVKLT